MASDDPKHTTETSSQLSVDNTENTQNTDGQQNPEHMDTGSAAPTPSNSAVGDTASSTTLQPPPAPGGLPAPDEMETSEESDANDRTANFIQSRIQLHRQKVNALYPKIPKVTGPPRGLNAPVFPRSNTPADAPEQRMDLAVETTPHLDYYQQHYSAADDDDDIASRPLAQPEYKMAHLNGVDVPLLTNQTPN